MDPKYLIGVPEMDEQHEKLLGLAAKVKTVGAEEFEMNEVILDLINYAISHLDNEEAFLKKNGLNDFLKEHGKKHGLFRGKAMDFYDDFRSADTVEAKHAIMIKVASFCESWLLQHINVEDRVYAELLKNKNGASGPKAS